MSRGRAIDARVRHWRNAVLTVFALSGFVFATWISRIPTARDVLHASTGEMGLLAGGISVGAIAGLLASSHLIAALGATRTIAICYGAACVGVVGAGLVAQLAPTFPGLLSCLVVLGAASSITDVAMNLSGAANERALGRTFMPIFHASFSFGTALGAGVGAVTIALGWPIAVHVCGVGVLAIAVLAVLVRYLQPAEEPLSTGQVAVRSTARARLAVWTRPRVLLVGLVVLGAAFAEGSANDWLSLAMVDGHGLTNAEGAAVFGVFVVAMTIARIGGVVVLDRFGRVPVLRSSAALAVAGLLLVIFGPSIPVVLVGVVLWGLGAALGFPVGMSAAADDPRDATASVSAVSTIGYTAFLVGPPVIGFLGQSVGLLHALLAVLALIVVGGLCAFAAREPGRATGAPSVG